MSLVLVIGVYLKNCVNVLQVNCLNDRGVYEQVCILHEMVGILLSDL